MIKNSGLSHNSESQASFNLNLNSNPKKISFIENDDKKLSSISSLLEIQEVMSKNPSNVSLQALKVIMEEEEKIVNILANSDLNNQSIEKFLDNDLDYTDPIALIETDNTINEMLKIQNQQLEFMDSIMDKNND